MKYAPRINRFVEERLRLTRYTLKVVVLLVVVTFLSMLFALVVDIFLSLRDVKIDVKRAAERAAKFRITAIDSVIVEVLKTDKFLVSLLELYQGISTASILSNYVHCFRGNGVAIGNFPEDILKKALDYSKGKDTYFYVYSDRWEGISIIRRSGNTYVFCHNIPQLGSILSGKLGAIAKYGAKFYLKKPANSGEGDILVSNKSSVANISMYVWVPRGNIVKTLIKDRILAYLRLYVLLLTFMAISYIIWAKIINYPIKRLKHIITQLEGGNYQIEFPDLLEAKDEFGAIAKLLNSFSSDTRSRLDKLELILDTALRSYSSPQELNEFIKRILGQINKIFSAQSSLFLVEDIKTGKFQHVIYSDSTSEEMVEVLLNMYKKERRKISEPSEDLTCVKEIKNGKCLSLALSSMNQYTFGGIVLLIDSNIDPLDESYLKVICQHLFNTVKLAHMAITDPLTGTMNRRMLEQDLGMHGRAAKSQGKPLSLIMIDIDNFKGINDTYGHSVGDEILKETALIIEKSVDESCKVYRYGGEEFAILCPDVDKIGAYEIAEKVRNKIARNEFKIENKINLYITVSCGIANFPYDAEEPQELLRIADIALYKAKSNGRNRTVMLMGKDDKTLFVHRFKLGKELKEALIKGNTFHITQPIYDLKNERVFGYELLFRVRIDGKVVTAGEFIDFVCELGIAEDIDKLTVNRAKKMLMSDNWKGKNLFINMFPSSMERGEIFSELETIPLSLRKRLFIEISEKEPFLSMEEARAYVEKLNSMGFNVVIDDFGSGFSSIFQIRHLINYISLIKIDGAFIRDIHRDPYNRAIVESMRTIADRFSIELVAEFIETEEDLKMVKLLGLRFGQGVIFKARGEADTVIT